MDMRVIAPRGHELPDGGIAWSGVLIVDGERVLRFSNAGRGGCLDLDWRPRYARRTEVERALAALADHEFEAVDAGIGVLWDAAVIAGTR